MKRLLELIDSFGGGALVSLAEDKKPGGQEVKLFTSS